jgi:antitoxin ParD1/3/4
MNTKYWYFYIKISEMSKNTSLTLGEHFEQIIKKSIESGRYSSTSEVIREGLRLVDEREQKINILREAIEAGERSGYVKNFDPVKYLAVLNQRLNN